MRDQILGVEMVVPAEHFFDQHAALLRDPLATALEVFFEPLLGRQRYFDGSERKIVRHARAAWRADRDQCGRQTREENR